MVGSSRTRPFSVLMSSSFQSMGMEFLNKREFLGAKITWHNIVCCKWTRQEIIMVLPRNIWSSKLSTPTTTIRVLLTSRIIRLWLRIYSWQISVRISLLGHLIDAITLMKYPSSSYQQDASLIETSCSMLIVVVVVFSHLIAISLRLSQTPTGLRSSTQVEVCWTC